MICIILKTSDIFYTMRRTGCFIFFAAGKMASLGSF